MSRNARENSLDPTMPEQGSPCGPGHSGPVGVGSLSVFQWLIVLSAGLVLVLGISWGLPDERRMKALLGGQTLTEQQRTQLISMREDYYRKADSQADEMAAKIRAGDKADLRSYARLRTRDEPPPVFSEQDRLIAFRSFIVRSAGMDEAKAYQALARMNPAGLDFDPRFFVYGGAYIYPLGCVLFVMKSAGLLHVTKDFTHYIDHPSYMANMYIAGRAMNVVAFMATLVLVALLGNRLWGRKAGTLAMAALCFSTIVSAHCLTSKPHVYAAFWVMLGVYLAVLYLERPSKFALCGVAVAGGMAVGSALPAGLVAVVVAAVLFDPEAMGRSVVSISAAWAGMALGFFATNPYALLAPARFMLDVMVVAGPDGWGYAGLSLAEMGRHLDDVFTRSYCFPASLAVFVGFVRTFRHGRGATRRLALAVAGLLLLLAMSPGPARVSIFLGPMLCLFVGYGLSLAHDYLRGAGKWAGAGLLVLAFLPGAFFSALFARDVIWNDNWYAPTMNWIESAPVTASTGMGTFGLPEPNYMVPFPFLNAPLVNLYKFTDERAAPDFVVLGNHHGFPDRALWAVHPLRDRYEPAYDLGFRPSYEWFDKWRFPSDARLAGWVYKKKVD